MNFICSLPEFCLPVNNPKVNRVSGKINLESQVMAGVEKASAGIRAHLRRKMTGSSINNQPEEWIAFLQSKGYRTSAPLRIVVEILSTSERVLSPLQIYDLVQDKSPKLSLVTVYRTVEKLEEIGLIQRVHQPSGCQAFIATNVGHQHLLICENCGRVEFFGGDRLEALMSEVSHETGYKIAEHWLQLFGVCERCQSSIVKQSEDNFS